MLPVLQAVAEGAKTVGDCIPPIRAQLGISDEDAAALTPSGSKTYLVDRIGWARTYLGKAGLVTSPKRGTHVVTPLGLKVLAQPPTEINLAFLDQFEGFKAWRTGSTGKTKADASGVAALPPAAAVASAAVMDQTPEEAIKAAHDLLGASLRDDLLAQLADLHPIRFERLILDLLSAMGFGGGDLSRTQMTKVSGDGGIDGIIHEDALGLDRVYIQAKRYGPGNTVGSPAIYQFVGSLTAQGAAKGVFVTTSDFSKDARSVASGITHHRIVLIDGQELARLMIRYGVGVRPRTTFVVHGIDEDYFKPADA